MQVKLFFGEGKFYNHVALLSYVKSKKRLGKVYDQFGAFPIPHPHHPYGMRRFVPHTSPVRSPKRIDFKMDNENVSGPRYTKVSPETIEIGAVPVPEVFDAEYTRRVAQEHLVCPSRASAKN
jgi:hypothetical protein